MSLNTSEARLAILLTLLGTASLCLAQSGDLFDAARTGDLQKLRQLAADPIAVNARGPGGRTALHEAAANCQVDATGLLVERGWDPQAVDDRKMIPAQLISRCAPDIALRIFSLLGPRTREKDPWSLQYSVAHRRISVVSVLLRMRVDVNALGSEGNRALDVACLDGDAPISRMLLENGADPNLRNKTGSTPLHDAALNGNKEVIELLLAHNAKINALVAEDGSTPLHYAASFHRLEAVQALVQHGADVTLKNAKGLTALQLARRNGFADISEFLSRFETAQ